MIGEQRLAAMSPSAVDRDAADPARVIAEPRLSSLSHGGGCGCKLAPGVLGGLLRSLPRMPAPEQLLVGNETSDGAAVYLLNPEQALVATTDRYVLCLASPLALGS